MQNTTNILTQNRTATGVFVLVLAFQTSGCDQFTPNTYEDCILRNVKGVTGDLAVANVISACANKFSKGKHAKSSSRPLQPIEYSQLTGRADHTPPSTKLNGNLYNGNTALHVTAVSLKLYTTVGGKEITRVYALETSIPPLSARNISVEVISGDPGTDFKWEIVGASGFAEN